MKKISVLLLLILCTPAAADVDDLKTAVEQAEAQSPEKKAEDESSPPPRTTSSSDLPILFLALWIGNNVLSTYGPHPYSSEGFVSWKGFVNHRVFDQPQEFGLKNYWYEVETQGLSLKDLGYGGKVVVKGHLWRFFGPYLETWTLYDGETFQYALQPGLQLSLVQSDPFSVAFYGQWNYWMGHVKRNGGAVGLEFRSLPVNPLAFQVRLGQQIFEKFIIPEVELQAGVYFQHWGLYAGYRWWSLQTTDFQEIKPYEGPFVGTKIHY